MSVAVLAIDPGSRASGIVVYQYGEKRPRWGCIASGQSRSRATKRLEGQILEISSDLGSIEAAALTAISRTRAKTLLICVEYPQAYRGSRVDPNDLIHLAAVAGACAHWGILLAEQLHMEADLLMPEPSSWKQQRDKSGHHTTTLRMMDVDYRKHPSGAVEPLGLFDDPRVTQALDWFDLMDAVCLGDWAQSRILRDGSGLPYGLLVQSGARPLRGYSGPFP